MRASDVIIESLSVSKDQLSLGSFADQARELSEITREFAEQHCQPWLRQAGAGLAFRGVSERVHQNRALFTHEVRHDRRPKDSVIQDHELFNGIIRLAGGIANRSNSTFVISNLNTASDYGRPFVVMPVGQFHYSWSPTVSDWYAQRLVVLSWWDVSAVMETTSRRNLEFLLGETSPQLIRKTLTSIKNSTPYEAGSFAQRARLGPEAYTAESLAPHVWADRGLDRALSTGYEVMIHAQEMLYLDATKYGDMVNYRVLPF